MLEQSLVMQEYQGTIRYNTNPDLRVRSAGQCFRNQMARCYNKKNPRYKDNGAKGITVEYTLRQFIAWYLIEIEKYEGVAPSVGRIDHSKGYSFDNIKIESLSDNVKERIRRVGPTKPRKAVKIFKGGKLWKTVESGFEAAKLTGVQTAHMSKYCSGRLDKSVTGFSFRYASEYPHDFLIFIKRPNKRQRKTNIYKDGVFVKTVASGNEAAEISGVQKSHIPRYCRGQLKTSSKGYSFKYTEEDNVASA